MKMRWLVVIALLTAFAVLTPSAMADKDKGKGKGKDNRAAKHQKHDDDRWERREGFEWRTYGDRDSRPPGWSRGKKTGWGNCGLPPGQAKKQGACRTYMYQGRPYYYYRDEAGRLIVRRPVIEIR